jgi:hypothetical protein
MISGHENFQKEPTRRRDGVSRTIKAYEEI